MSFPIRRPLRAPQGALGLLALTALALGACADAPSGVASPDAPSLPEAARMTSAPATSGAYIVQFVDDERDPGSLARKLVASQGGTLRFTYTAALKGFAAELPTQAIEALRRNPRVQRIEPDIAVALASSGSQLEPPSWGLDRIDQRLRRRDRSYSWLNDGAGAHVYVFDTGIRASHEEFGGRVGAGHTVINDGNGTNDCHGHGTSVAATVGGRQFGVAKGVWLHPVRVMDCSGSGSMSGVISGLDWVLRNGHRPAVVNMSLGGRQSSSLNTAIQSAADAGVMVVAAAGNSGLDACTESPASAPAALTVAASDALDDFAPFSNHGPCVDLAAPGVSVVTASHTSDVATRTVGGTSMSAPHVAGVAAIVLTARPTASVQQVEESILQNATSGALGALPPNTPNRLLYSLVVEDQTQSPPGNAAPRAAFTVACADRTCTFADQSTDSDGVVASRFWEFGDGSTSTTTNPTRTYASDGTYTVRLTVTDDAGATGTTSQVIAVTGTLPNQSPTAAFAVTCNERTCSFADQSNDPDGAVASRRWEFGDGSSSATTNPTHTYAADGTYTLRLTVTDDAGATGSTTQTLTVAGPPPANSAPSASFTISCPGNRSACNVDASRSSDDKGIVRYEWNFGDGSATVITTEPQRSHRYQRTGTFTVTLTVFDLEGLRASTQRTQTVRRL